MALHPHNSSIRCVQSCRLALGISTLLSAGLRFGNHEATTHRPVAAVLVE